MTLRPAIAFAMLAAVLLLPASACAAAAGLSATQPTAGAMPSRVTTTSGSTSLTVTYDLTWTLPTAGKSGCTVCHSDKDLVRIQAGKTVSLYVNTAVLKNSAHKDVPCTGCHVDFAFKAPHSNVSKVGNEWRAVAKLSCKNCHRNEFSEFTAGAHSPTTLSGRVATSTVGRPNSSAPGMPKPYCGDCHGGHSIAASDNVVAMRLVHATGIEMCGKCHKESTASYQDYYHGAAYREGAPDAPACWDCHNTHKILVSSDRQSSVYSDRLYDTCNKCHRDPRDGYTAYARLIHGKQAVLDSNPVIAWLKLAQQQIGLFVQKTEAIF